MDWYFLSCAASIFNIALGRLSCQATCVCNITYHLDWTILGWYRNTDTVFKKGQSGLFLLRRLGSSNICRTMLCMFYHSVVVSIIFHAAVCWGSRVKAADAYRLNKLINKAIFFWELN